MIHSRLHRFVNQRKIILPKTKKLQVRSLPEHLYNRARIPPLHYFSYKRRHLLYLICFFAYPQLVLLKTII